MRSRKSKIEIVLGGKGDWIVPENIQVKLIKISPVDLFFAWFSLTLELEKLGMDVSRLMSAEAYLKYNHMKDKLLGGREQSSSVI